MCWLILHVNLTGLRDAQIAGKTLFLGVSMTVLPGASLVAQRLKHLPAMRETWVQSLVQEDPLEKEMAIHSSIFAWRISWMEEPGRLQSTGLQRVRHDWATLLHFSKEDCLGIIQLLRAKMEQNRVSVLSLPLDIDASGSWTFRLKVGLLSLAPLVLKPSV